MFKRFLLYQKIVIALLLAGISVVSFAYSYVTLKENKGEIHIYLAERVEDAALPFHILELHTRPIGEAGLNFQVANGNVSQLRAHSYARRTSLSLTKQPLRLIHSPKKELSKLLKRLESHILT